MKILLINQFFWPDLAPTGQLLTDLARHLAATHDVTVICSAGSYAEAKPTGDPPPVRILRIPGWHYQRGTLSRLASYSTFLAGALWQEFRMPRPDLVLTMTTPPLLSGTGTILKKLRGVRHYIWEMDVFPDVLVSVGALRDSGIIARTLRAVENACHCRSDGVIVLGSCMRRRLVARGLPADLLHIAENWADGDLIAPQPFRRHGPLHILYSGNLGVSHDIDTIASAILHFRNDPRFVFIFAGGGAGWSRIEHLDAANIRLLPYAARESMSDHLAQADIGLVTESPVSLGTVVPSKTYGLMAAARPVLFIGPKQATPAQLIERFNCGWQINPGNVRSLVRLLPWMAANREALHMRGERGREAFERHYDVRHGVARVAEILGLETTLSRPQLARAVSR